MTASAYCCPVCFAQGTAWIGDEGTTRPLVDAERTLHVAATGHNGTQILAFGFFRSPFPRSEIDIRRPLGAINE